MSKKAHTQSKPVTSPPHPGQKRKDAPPTQPDDNTDLKVKTATTTTPPPPTNDNTSELKMSKKMKSMMQSSQSLDNKTKNDNQLVQLPPPTTAPTPATTQPKKSTKDTTKFDQLAQLRQLTQQSTTIPSATEPKSSKIKVLAPKLAPKITAPTESIATKIKIIPTNTQSTKPKATLNTNSISTQISQTPHSNKNENSQQSTTTTTQPAQQQQQQQQPDQTKTSLQDALEKKMQGAQFRVLNQQLYTTTSESAVELMKGQPELFEIYHQGFRTQVEKWPVNPLTVIINKIKGYITTIQKSEGNNNDNKKETKKENKREGEEKNNDSVTNNTNKAQKDTNILSIADFGCGDAEMALTLATHATKIPFNAKSKTFITSDQAQQGMRGNNKNSTDQSTINTVCAIGKNCQIYSFDLVAPESKCLPLTTTTTPNNNNNNNQKQTTKQSTTTTSTTSAITACDSRNVPIPNNSVDLAVFCLSLMGTNFKDFLMESHRVLQTPQNRSRPSLIIAEVRSRFDEQQKELGGGKGDDVYKTFIKFVEKLGFSCLNMDKSNKMFVVFEFVKTKSRGNNTTTTLNEKNDDFTLKPCIYKRR